MRDVVASGRGNLQRSFGGGLAPHVAEVAVVEAAGAHEGRNVGARRSDRGIAPEMGADLEQCRSPVHLETLDD